MKKLLSGILIFMVSISVLAASFAACEAGAREPKISSGIKLVNAFEGGRLFLAGGMKVVQLNGNFRQMGRQYGMLLKEDINAMYDLIVNKIMIGQKKMKYEEIISLARTPDYEASSYIKEMTAGMAETSGLTYDQADVVRLNLLYLASMCSAAAAYSDYSADGSVVFGRNLDLGKNAVELLKPFTVMVIYNPIGTGKNSVAEITSAGAIYAQTLFNKSGMILEMNNGMMSRLPVAEEKIKNDPLAYKMYDLMFDCSDIADVLAGIAKIKINLGMMLNVADGKAAYCCEIAPEGVFVRHGDKPGFLAVSNHFLNPDWKGGIKIGKGRKYSKTLERHSNLMKQADRHKGRFDAKLMMSIFDRTIPAGGPTFPAKKSADTLTLYSCVFTPADMKLFVKNREITDWIEIRLNELFLPKTR